MSRLKTLIVATLCGLILAQWSLADRKSDEEREARAQKAKERREREALLEPLRPLLDSPVDSSRYKLDPTKEVPQHVRDYVAASAAERVGEIKNVRKAIERQVELVAEAASAPRGNTARGKYEGDDDDDGSATAAEAEVRAREALAKAVRELKKLVANDPRFLAPLPGRNQRSA